MSNCGDVHDLAVHRVVQHDLALQGTEEGGSETPGRAPGWWPSRSFTSNCGDVHDLAVHRVVQHDLALQGTEEGGPGTAG